jgi:hypothetical protein
MQNIPLKRGRFQAKRGSGFRESAKNYHQARKKPIKNHQSLDKQDKYGVI